MISLKTLPTLLQTFQSRLIKIKTFLLEIPVCLFRKEWFPRPPGLFIHNFFCLVDVPEPGLFTFHLYVVLNTDSRPIWILGSGPL